MNKETMKRAGYRHVATFFKGGLTMIKIISKASEKAVAYVSEYDFKIDEHNIYGKDENGGKVHYSRREFYALKEPPKFIEMA